MGHLVRYHPVTVTPWREFLIEKLIVTKLVKRIPSVYETKYLLLFSQVHTTGPRHSSCKSIPSHIS
jgi:hypothetical protein